MTLKSEFHLTKVLVYPGKVITVWKPRWPIMLVGEDGKSQVCDEIRLKMADPKYDQHIAIDVTFREFGGNWNLHFNTQPENQSRFKFAYRRYRAIDNDYTSMMIIGDHTLFFRDHDGYIEKYPDLL